MKRIPLSNGMFALVDDDVFAEVSKFSWHYKASRLGGGYAFRNTPRVGGRHTTAKLHHLVLPLTGKLMVDHINGDGLDNRRNNLRLVNASQNQANRQKSPGKTSQYKGVSWDKNRACWYAHIKTGQRMKNLGRFASEEAAALAYNDAAIKAFGEFARLNVIPLERGPTP